MKTDNYTEKDYDKILYFLKNKIILDRIVLGFKDDPKANYTPEEMMEKAIELEVYKNIKKHVQNKGMEEAWDEFYNDNKSDIKLVNNKNDYKNIFKHVYHIINIKHLSPNKVIDYIKKQELKINRGECAIG